MIALIAATLLAADAAAPACREVVPDELEPIPLTHLEQLDFAGPLSQLCTKLKKLSRLQAASSGWSYTALDKALSGDAAARDEGVRSLATLKLVCLGIEDAFPTRFDVLREVLANRDRLAKGIAQLRDDAAPPDLFSSPSVGKLQDSTAGMVLDPLGNLESQVIQGLATFIADRARAEAMLYLSEQLKASLCTFEGRRFLPAFCAAFDSLDAHLQLAAMGAYLSTAAREDLARAPQVLLKEATCAAPAKAEPLAMARVGYAVFQRVHEGNAPLEVLRNVQRVKLECERKPATAEGVLDCSGSMGVLRTASRLFESVQRERSSATIASRPLTDVAWRYWAASVVTLYSEDPSADLSNADQWLAPLQRVAVELQLLRTVFEKLAADTEKQFTPKDLAQATAQALRSLGALAASVAAAQKRDVAPLEELTALSSLGASLVTGGAFAELATGLTRHVALLQRRYGSRIALPEPMKKALPLLAELANARSSDEVAKTLEAAAAPVGSYRNKYEKPGVAINAFVGLAGGYEALDDPGTATDGAVLSIFAPIGLHATTPIAGNWLALGAMLSVLDLGGVLAPRIGNPSQPDPNVKVETEAHVGFAQVLSPGLYATLGLARSPFTLGFGASMVPALRNVTTKTTLVDGSVETRVDARTAFRLGAFLAIDVTIFPL
ncbi:MAG: hypothetical protein IPJ65_33690 [Archangiaceae bacterium]|nr:hypothetical protein [Archangiaceae bacterium]